MESRYCIRKYTVEARKTAEGPWTIQVPGTDSAETCPNVSVAFLMMHETIMGRSDRMIRDERGMAIECHEAGKIFAGPYLVKADGGPVYAVSIVKAADGEDGNDGNS